MCKCMRMYEYILIYAWFYLFEILNTETTVHFRDFFYYLYSLFSIFHDEIGKLQTGKRDKVIAW